MAVNKALQDAIWNRQYDINAFKKNVWDTANTYGIARGNWAPNTITSSPDRQGIERTFAQAQAAALYKPKVKAKAKMPVLPTKTVLPTYAQARNAVFANTRRVGQSIYEDPTDLAWQTQGKGQAAARQKQLDEEYERAMAKYAVDLRKYTLGY